MQASLQPLPDAEKDSPISATVPDWSREFKPFFSWRPGSSLLGSLRSYEKWNLRRGPIAAAMRTIAIFRHRFWSVVTGADIPLRTNIGGGLLVLHPNGIVIHPDVVIGPNCLIFQQVTLGTGRGGVPRIGGHVDIGAGAKILGKITIGDHAKIGANAVVLCDVPPFASAVGVPAHIINHPAQFPR
jgi:serine O-acetyltransferase